MLIDIKVPALAESVSEASLMTWHKKVGDYVEKGAHLIDIETDKVTLEITALNDGVLTEILEQDGAIVVSDQIIARIDDSADASMPESSAESAAKESAAEPAEEDQEQSTDAVAKTSPSVRHLIQEKGLHINDIAHESDRVTKQDVLNHLNNETGDQDSPEQAMPEDSEEDISEDSAESIDIAALESSPVVPVLVNSVDKNKRRDNPVPMTRLRKRIAERLLSAQRESAILTTFNEVNMKAVMMIRQQYQESFQKIHQVKLGFMSFFVQAAIAALKKFPVVNSSIEGDNIVYHNYYDMGIAVGTEKGLVVPILRDADKLSLSDIEIMIRDFGLRAQEGSLTLDELSGGTFTITNGGVFGSLLSTPIINPPQSGILGMHSIQQRPIVENGEIVACPMMYLALSYDHRIIDGREAVQFLGVIKRYIESPACFLLQV